MLYRLGVVTSIDRLRLVERIGVLDFRLWALMGIRDSAATVATKAEAFFGVLGMCSRDEANIELYRFGRDSSSASINICTGVRPRDDSIPLESILTRFVGDRPMALLAVPDKTGVFLVELVGVASCLQIAGMPVIFFLTGLSFIKDGSAFISKIVPYHAYAVLGVT